MIERQVPASLTVAAAPTAASSAATTTAASSRFTSSGRTGSTCFGSVFSGLRRSADPAAQLVQPGFVDLAIGARQALANAFGQCGKIDRGGGRRIGRVPTCAKRLAHRGHSLRIGRTIRAAEAFAHLCDTGRIDLPVFAAQSLLHLFRQLGNIGLCALLAELRANFGEPLGVEPATALPCSALSRCRSLSSGSAHARHEASAPSAASFAFGGGLADFAEEVETVADARRITFGKRYRPPVQFHQLPIHARHAIRKCRLDGGCQDGEAFGHVVRTVAEIFNAEIGPVEQIEIVGCRQFDVALRLRKQIRIAARDDVGQHRVARDKVEHRDVDVDDLRRSKLGQARCGLAHGVARLQRQAFRRPPVQSGIPVGQRPEIGKVVDAAAQIETEFAQRAEKILARAGERYTQIDPGKRAAAVERCFQPVRTRVCAVDSIEFVPDLGGHIDLAARQQDRLPRERRECIDRIGLAARLIEASAGNGPQITRDVDLARSGRCHQAARIASAIDFRRAPAARCIQRQGKVPVAHGRVQRTSQ